MYFEIIFPENPGQNYIVTITTEDAIPVLMKDNKCSRAIVDYDNLQIILYK